MINLQLTNSEAIALEMLLAMVRVVHATPDMKPELILQLLKLRGIEDIQVKLSEKLNEVQQMQAIANGKFQATAATVGVTVEEVKQAIVNSKV